MIIPCFRCRKRIDTPNSSNADYVIADDMVVREPREVLVALKHNPDTLSKSAKAEPVADSEYDHIEVSSLKDAMASLGEDLVKLITEVRDKDIQKTGVVCPDCFSPSDLIIWGVHKEAV